MQNKLTMCRLCGELPPCDEARFRCTNCEWIYVNNILIGGNIHCRSIEVQG